MPLRKLEGTYFEAYKNQVRDVRAPAHSLPPSLARLGRQVAQAIMSDALGEAPQVEVQTPMGQTVTSPVPRLPHTLVLTTRQERSYLGEPIRQELGALHAGYLVFGNLRGPEVLAAAPTEAAWPAVGTRVELLVIAKSVLASGCTALALARRAIDRFQPAQVVIASIFYSNEGVAEMQAELPNARVYVLGEPDRLTRDGMLEPGVGLIEQRLPGDDAPLFQDVDGLAMPALSPIPDSLMNVAFQRIDELARQGLIGLTPLESYALARHYVEQFAAAESAGRGSPQDLMGSLTLEDAEAILRLIRRATA